MSPIVIVGSGLAGYNTARELRKLDRETPLVIVTADGGEFYSKPTLSNALAAGKSPQAIALSTASQMAEQTGAQVRTVATVTAIDPGNHRVHLGAETIGYSKLVLALGAAQIRLPLAGDATQAVLSVNGLDDYARFRAAIEGRRRIAIIGAGLIGCEFANDLAGAGYAVSVIDIAEHPLPRLLPPQGAAMLRDRLAAIGVAWHFGASVSAVDRAGDALRLTLADGAAIEADVVLSAVGLKAKLDLARAAGLAANRAIAVDRRLQTSDRDVHALGDCAEVDGLVLPFVMPITHASRTLAAVLAGRDARLSYPPMPVLVKTPACPTIVAPPAAGTPGEWQVEQTADGVKALYVGADGRLLGFALNGSATAERAKLAPQLPPVLA